MTRTATRAAMLRRDVAAEAAHRVIDHPEREPGLDQPQRRIPTALAGDLPDLEEGRAGQEGLTRLNLGHHRPARKAGPLERRAYFRPVGGPVADEKGPVAPLI